jgi:hypothetical protein
MTSTETATAGLVRRAWGAVREFIAVQMELQERMALRNRPWEEEFLHWAGGELHGWRMPPPGRQRSMTRSGWCPGLAARQPR